jgi:hypothetical protein
VKVPQHRRAEALYKVLLDAAGGGDEAVDELVLREEADDFAQAGGDEVGGVAEEEGEGGVGVGALFALGVSEGLRGAMVWAVRHAYG